MTSAFHAARAAARDAAEGACEGELEGLAVTRAQAQAIADYTVAAFLQALPQGYCWVEVGPGMPRQVWTTRAHADVLAAALLHAQEPAV